MVDPGHMEAGHRIAWRHVLSLMGGAHDGIPLENCFPKISLIEVIRH